MAEISSCLVCKGTDLEVLFVVRDCLVTGDLFNVKKCMTCGFVFTSDPPDEKDISGYYKSEDYISHSDKKSNIADHAYHFARSIMLRKKYRLIRKVCEIKTGSIVDIGSGTGYFAHYMKKKGWNVTGIEINDPARSFSAEKFGIRVADPSAISGIPDVSVDCITFWHVLEHLYDPVKWMSEVKRILRKNGKCIIALPNVTSADAEWFGSSWAALDVPRHLWHFSPSTLVRFIESNGLSCKMIKSMPLDIFYISTLSYRYKAFRTPLIRGVITGMMLSLVNLFRKNRASSLIYIISGQAA